MTTPEATSAEAMNDVRRALRESTRKFLTRHATPVANRHASRSPLAFDGAVWRRCVEELGWTAIAIPERWGGFGASWTELAVIFEESGHALLCAPLLSASMGIAVALELGEEAPAGALESLALGDRRATVTLGQPTSVSAAGTNLYEGRALDAVGADVLLARVDEAIYWVEDFEAEALPTMDETRRLARVRFDPDRARCLGGGAPAWRRGMDVATALLAAEQVGGAQWCLDAAVDYAKTRTQFGRPIGSFQAIKHKCADMLLLVETARSIKDDALRAVDADADDREIAVASAAAWCSDAFFTCAGEAIQIFGGIGFTWEHDAHLYFKRARASRSLLGPPRADKQRVMTLLEASWT